MTNFESPIFDSWKRQIVTGTVLGGSSIVKPPKGKNCFLFMRSSNHKWLDYKSQELVNFSSQRPFTREGNTIRWHSTCYPIFNEMRDLFYVNNKKTVNMNILNTLRDIGLAIWYGDCGNIIKNQVIMQTHKFGKENEIICNYFNEVGIESEIFLERKNYRIKMSEKGSIAFLRVIAHRLPKFMF